MRLLQATLGLLRRLNPAGVPLAWLQLVSERKRFLAALGGVAFAVTLMLYQLGVYRAVFAKVVFPHRALAGDLVMVSVDYNNLYTFSPFPVRRLRQAEGFPEVAGVAPVRAEFASIRNPVNRQAKRVFVFGVDPAANPFGLPEVENNRSLLQSDEHALFDALSQNEFGPIPDLLTGAGKVETEVNGRRLTIGGLFRMGATIGCAGHIIVGERAFDRLFGDASSHLASLGMIRLNPGVDPEGAAARLRRELPPDIQIMTRLEFIEGEKTYWAERSPVAFVFLGTLVVAMVVGSVIVYQILYTDVNDHLREYATLKAIGYGDRFFYGLVLQEALIILVLGFIPGLALTGILAYGTRLRSSLPLDITPGMVAVVFGLALAMCSLAGLLATRRLRSADPADIF